MNRVIEQRAAASRGTPLSRIAGTPRLALALITSLLSSGVVTNDKSYLIVLPLFALCALHKKDLYSPFRRKLIWLTLVLIIFGTVKGVGQGNSFTYVLRFTLPFTVFFLFLALPGFGFAVARSRILILAMGLPVTAVFFFAVKTGNWAMVDSLMQGWTITYSSNAAVSVWMYFMLPVCAVSVLGLLYREKNTSSLCQAGAGLMVLLMLALMNDTSAYLLAILSLTLLFILPRKYASAAVCLFTVTIWLLIIDFLTLKILSRLIASGMNGGIEDIGDALRLIQVEYFVDRSEFFGSGFGAQHDFPFMISIARQQAQLEFPYASELPVLNMIFNGGIFAGAWFMMVSWSFFRLVSARSGSGDRKFEEVRLFGLGAVGVLIGSISNPYLFAPTSMILLAVLVDLADAMGPQDVPYRERS